MHWLGLLTWVTVVERRHVGFPPCDYFHCNWEREIVNLPFWVLEKRILLLGFVRGMDTFLGTFAWLLGDAGSVSSNTKVAVLGCASDWFKSCWAHGVQPVIHPTDTRLGEKEVSQNGIQDSHPVVKGVTTIVRVLSAGASAPFVVSSLREVVICIHSWPTVQNTLLKNIPSFRD